MNNYKLSYDYELKKTMNITNFFKNKQLRELENKKNIKKAKQKEITKSILSLDENIQKKIYIYAMKEYWKYKMISTPLLSLRDKYNNHLQKELSKTVLNNVHFLHLDFNCKPGYKKYISGCQCEFCIAYPKEEKDYEYVNIMDDGDPYFDCEANYEYSENTLPLNWFNIYSEEESYMNYFDFMKGSYEEVIHSCPHESPQYFSYEAKTYIDKLVNAQKIKNLKVDK